MSARTKKNLEAPNLDSNSERHRENNIKLRALVTGDIHG